MRTLLERTAGPCVTVRLDMGDDGATMLPELEELLVGLAKDVRAALPAGGRVAISVVRTGMQAEVRATVDGADGCGLDLPSVRAVAKRDGGRVDVDGRRVEVRVTLGGTRESSRAALRGKGETVLVVEDSENLRRLLCRMLRDAGYRPLSAGSPEDALRICDAESASIALMLTDVIMPEMSGRELALRVADRYGMTRVLFMSGYDGDVVAKQGGLVPGTRLLQKPFAEADLLRAMRAVLDP